MTEQTPERRKHKRLPINCEVLITILIPEKTFSPHTVRGIGMDISESGLKAVTYQLKKKEYLDLLKEVRYAKLDIILPYFDEPIQLTARIVWLDYREKSSTKDKPYCSLGFYFHKVPERAKQRLDYALTRLETESYTA